MNGTHPASKMVIENYDGARTLHGLVAMINQRLYGRRVIKSMLDTADSFPCIRSSYTAVTQMTTVEADSSHPAVIIRLENCGFIHIFDLPVEYEGRTHTPSVAFNGDHVAISIPYLFGTKGLMWVYHSLSPHRSVET